MSIFKRKKHETTCAHSWHVIDVETVYFNAGSSVDFEDITVLGCAKCGGKRRVDEYELYRLQRVGLIHGGVNA